MLVGELKQRAMIQPQPSRSPRCQANRLIGSRVGTPNRRPSSRVTDATKEEVLGSMAQALGTWGCARGAFKNNNSKRLSHVSDPEAIAKHNSRLHNSTGTPYSEHWARHDSVS